MKKTKILALMVPVLGFASLTCALFAATPAVYADDAAANYGIPHATISFSIGSSLLTSDDKAMLRKLVSDMPDPSSTHVTIAAWSDKNLPAMHHSLMNSDRQLAELRAQTVASYLRSQTLIKDVDNYSMAETSNWLAKKLNTQDEELQSTFSKQGAELPVTQQEFQLIKDLGCPSEAVVVLRR